MNHSQRDDLTVQAPLLTRRSLLCQTGASVAFALASSVGSAQAASRLTTASQIGAVSQVDPQPPAGDPQPRDAFRGILDALDKFPLVAIGERHLLQEWHDFVTALFFNPDLPAKINDVVVEFGNAQYQALADRFILENEPVANADLEQIWRHTIGGGVLWDAPVYGQFFRTVRAVNWMLPKAKRIRVLLGDPDFDYRKVQSAADRAYLAKVGADRDPHFAALVEREVLGKGRRALLLAGAGHLLRNVKNDRTGQPNAASLLDQKNAGRLFVVAPLTPPLASEGSRAPREQALLKWPRPAFATLAGTWLGADRGPMAHRALNPAAGHFSDQADAVLYLGPSEVLTASRAEPALYQGGTYADEVKHWNEIAKKLGIRGQDGLAMARLGPRYFQR
jgi:hypothetical protein